MFALLQRLAALPFIALLFATPAAAIDIVDTGVGNGSNFLLDNQGWIAAQFRLDDGLMVTKVEAYMGTEEGSLFTLQLRSNTADNRPGDVLFSQQVDLGPAPLDIGWRGVEGLTWGPAGGHYWIVFAVTPADDLVGFIRGGAPTPLGAEATSNTLGLTWNRINTPDFSLRILGGISAVPEPGAWALMIVGFGLAGAALRRRDGDHRQAA